MKKRERVGREGGVVTGNNSFKLSEMICGRLWMEGREGGGVNAMGERVETRVVGVVCSPSPIPSFDRRWTISFQIVPSPPHLQC